GLAVPSGGTFWIRWNSFDVTGSDDGLAIDDFSLTPNLGPDAAPSVSSTTPANGATGVAVNASVSVTFSEPVNVLAWFQLSCTSSGLHTASQSGGPTTFTLS